MSYCTQCGKKLLEQDKFCASCGQKVELIQQESPKTKSFEERLDEILKVETAPISIEKVNIAKEIPIINVTDLSNCKDKVATIYAMYIAIGYTVIFLGSVFLEIFSRISGFFTFIAVLIFFGLLIGYPFFIFKQMSKNIVGRYRIGRYKNNQEIKNFLLAWVWASSWRSYVVGLIVIYPLIYVVDMDASKNPILSFVFMFLLLAANAYITMHWILKFQYGSSKLVVLDKN